MKIERKRVENRDIDLIDMCWDLLSKWKWIVGVSLVGGIISLVIFGNAYKHEEKSKAEILTELSEEEEKQVDMYVSYEELYYEQLAYNQKSWLMTLNSNGFYEGHVKYYMGENANGFLIQEMYLNSLSDSQLVNNIMTALELDGDDEVLYEMVSTQSLTAVIGEKNNNMEDGEINSFDIYVWSNDEDECKQLVSEVEKHLTEKSTSISARLGEHSLVQLVGDVGRKSSTGLLNFQKSNLEALETLENKVIALQKELSTSQIDAVLEKSDYSGIDASQLITADADNSEKVIFPVKKVVLIVLCLMVLTVVFFVFRYLFSSLLRIQDDFADLYNISVLVKMSEDKKKGFLSNKIEKARNRKHNILDEESALEYLSIRFQHLCSRKKSNKITFLSSHVTDREKKIVEQIKEIVKKQNIEVEFAGNIISDSQAIELAYRSDCCILIEQSLKANSFDVAQVVNLCDEQNIPLAGAVIVS